MLDKILTYIKILFYMLMTCLKFIRKNKIICYVLIMIKLLYSMKLYK